MVTRRLRSEYMKKFKDPKWETYGQCYEETLRYRLTRRLLEHTHNPWFWSASDTDSDSGGRSPPPPPNHRPPPETCKAPGPQGPGPGPPVLGLPPPPEEAEDPCVAAGGDEGTLGRGDGGCGPKTTARKQEQGQGDGQTKPAKAAKAAKRSRKASAASAQQRREEKLRRHPFALYGSGEKDASTAGRKTHNVLPAASTHQIHESALRAKTRREVERQIQTQRAERRRAKSADLARARKAAQPEFNPWLTEYMRCFSVRSRVRL